MLYLFACISPECIKRSDSVRAFRQVNHDRNSHVTFASDEDYNFVIDRSDTNLRTSHFASLYDDIQEDDDEDGDSDDRNEAASDSAEDEVDEADVDAMAASRTASKQISTIGKEAAAETTKYGALSFKPKLKEFLIDTCSEKQSDTLFYVR